MKIDLPLWDLQRSEWKVVPAELVDVAPHLSGTFAVHPCPWKPGKWVVTNVETGGKVEDPLTFFPPFSRREAIQAARAFLARKTEEEYQAALEKVAAFLPPNECHSACRHQE